MYFHNANPEKEFIGFTSIYQKLKRLSRLLASTTSKLGVVCYAGRSGIEPDSHGLTVRPHTDVRFGQHNTLLKTLVLSPGIELGFDDYKSTVIAVIL